ncbi:MAG: DUF4131 domain-containing protein [Clostridia bacterium]
MNVMFREEDYFNINMGARERNDKMKRPIVVVAIGMIIGIIGGLHLQNAVPIFLVIILVILFCKKNYKRYVRVFMPFSTCILLIFSICFSVTYITFCERRYQTVQEGQTKELIGIIQSEVIEKEYTYEYTIKVKEIGKLSNVAFKLYVKNKKDRQIYHYGDKVWLQGEIELSSESRNEKGFNQALY